jgi:predicted amidophosphoribosyltransferase
MTRRLKGRINGYDIDGRDTTDTGKTCPCCGKPISITARMCKAHSIEWGAFKRRFLAYARRVRDE